MNSIGAALVWCVIQVTLLASVAALVYGLVRRSGPPARALAALAGLMLIVGLSVLTFSPWPRWGMGTQEAVADTEKTTTSLQHGETASDDDGDLTEGKAQGQPLKSAQPGDMLSPSAEFFKTLVSEMQHVPASPERETWGWRAYVALLFALGAGLGLVRLVAGLAAVRSYRRRARPIADAALLETADILLAELRGPKGVVLCESDLLSTPATIGWRKPLIILPTDWTSWTEEEKRAVLAHEIAHIARHDFPTWVTAQLALVFHFYHPLVHWLAARLRLEQELAADAAAAALTGGQRTYLTTLAGMALRQSDRPLAWPARTFLPTRGTFMRRIEMLRDEKLLSTKMTAGMRTALVAVLSAASLAVAGLRGTAADRKAPGGTSPAAALADDPKTKPAPARGTGITATSGTSNTTGTSGSSSTTTATSDAAGLAWVPRDAIAVARFRPAELLRRPALAALRQALGQQKELQEQLGVSPDKIEQVTVVFLIDAPPPGTLRGEPAPAGFIIRLADASDAASVLKALQPNPKTQEYSGQSFVGGSSGRGQFAFIADDRTVVSSDREEHLRRLIVAGKNGAVKAKWADAWKTADDADLAALVNTAALRDMLNQAMAGGPGPAIAPLWQAASSALLAANLRDRLDLTLKMAASNEEDSQKVLRTLNAVVTLAQNSLSQARGQFSQMPGEQGAVLLRAADTADSLLDSLKIERDGQQIRATATAEADDTAQLVAMLLPAVAQARQSARRAQSFNNLKQLALAMHNYADVNNSFPPAVLYGPDGKTPYSWRVALLPYLDQDQLFKQYKFDEPWDSENNKKVLAKMPNVFRDPNDPPDSISSSYYGLVGPSTIFPGKKEGTKFLEILDGTSGTIMFVEAKRDIPWTKPEDIPYADDVPPANAAAPPKSPSRYAGDKPIPKLGGHYSDVFLAALCDGSVRAISQKSNEYLLRSLFTRDGGEVIDFQQLDNPQPAPGGRVPTTPPKPGR
jgi:beta-lactamase regulating signal transducer with metallopeptidase domain